MGEGRAGLQPPRAIHLVGLLLLAFPACGYFSTPPLIAEPVDRIAVLPIVRDEPRSDEAATQRLLPGAENVVTAQIYGVLSSSPQWRFVPDLTVAQVLPKVPRTGTLTERAQALGRLVGADAVLCGSVSRYIERVGGEFGAREPAAVSFTLQLVSVSSGAVLWVGSFDETQQALSENLLNWWQFWRGGPRWFTAQELTRLGVERLLEQLAAQLE
jgi:hypothetical protein